MALTRINHNIASINANRNLSGVSNDLQTSLERLSSGLRINRAADDAAGLSISERQRSQIRGLNRAMANAQDAIGLINTAEGALNETTSRLQRIRELAVQAANTGGQDAEAVQAAQDEIETSIQEITRIAESTQYSTRVLLNGDNSNSVSVKDGANARGVSVAQTTVNSSLPTGDAHLKITQTQTGTEYMSAGSDNKLNMGLVGGADAADAITNNTFATGTYEVTVGNVTEEATQVVNSAHFTGVDDGADLATAATYQGVTLAVGDTVTARVTLNDGSITSATLTVDAATDMQDIAGLATTAAGAAIASSLNQSSGTDDYYVQVTDASAGDSQLKVEYFVDDASAATGLDGVYEAAGESTVSTLGSYNSAVLTIDGGAAVTAKAGDTVTLYGREPATAGQFQREVTLAFTSADAFISEGTETLNVTENQYSLSLNDGRAVDVVAGQEEVVVRTGTGGGESSGDFLVVNMGNSIDMSGETTQTVILSSTNNGLDFQIGANEGQNINVGLSDLRANKLGYADTAGLEVNGTAQDASKVSEIDVRTVTGAENAIRIVDRALAQVSRQRSYLGATTNRLQATISNLGVASENLTAAESRIRDADIASETTSFTRNQILMQAGTAMLAQANLQPRSVLQLLA